MSESRQRFCLNSHHWPFLYRMLLTVALTFSPNKWVPVAKKNCSQYQRFGDQLSKTRVCLQNFCLPPDLNLRLSWWRLKLFSSPLLKSRPLYPAAFLISLIRCLKGTSSSTCPDDIYDILHLQQVLLQCPLISANSISHSNVQASDWGITLQPPSPSLPDNPSLSLSHLTC